MPDQDPMQIQWDAMETAIEHTLDMRRKAKAYIATRPAVGRRLSKDERREEYLKLRAQPELIRSMVQEFQQRYKLPPDKPIPRAVVERILMGERDIADLKEEAGPAIVPPEVT